MLSVSVHIRKFLFNVEKVNISVYNTYRYRDVSASKNLMK